MKATSTTTTKVSVYISAKEIAEFVRLSGIHVPDHLELDIYSAPFDAEDTGGVLVEWIQHAPVES